MLSGLAGPIDGSRRDRVYVDPYEAGGEPPELLPINSSAGRGGVAPESWRHRWAGQAGPGHGAKRAPAALQPRRRRRWGVAPELCEVMLFVIGVTLLVP